VEHAERGPCSARHRLAPDAAAEKTDEGRKTAEMAGKVRDGYVAAQEDRAE